MASCRKLDLVGVEGRAVVPARSKHGVYVLIRGNGCPLCIAQVKEISAQHRELEDP
ncbi:MAG: hypothetical protein WBN70_15630 [Polyangiales bacterium]